jgi:ABC-type polar amino acid transport system ATPase subunit
MTGQAPSPGDRAGEHLATSPVRAEVIVLIEHLSKSFDGRLVLDDVHLKVDRGKIVSIIGQSGGGKTTLLRCVNLLERPDHGLLTVAGETIFSGDRLVCRDLARLRQTVGMVFQRFNLFPHLTAVENVMLAQLRAGVPEQVALERSVQLLRRVGLAHRGVAYPEQLSGGEQQRVAIARALIGRPSVVLADEPTGNLDSKAGAAIVDLLLRVRAEHDVTLVVATHEQHVAARCDRLVRLLDGAVADDIDLTVGEPAEVTLRRVTGLRL